MASPVLTEEERAEGDSVGEGLLLGATCGLAAAPGCRPSGQMSSFHLISEAVDGVLSWPRPAGTERQKSFQLFG